MRGGSAAKSGAAQAQANCGKVCNLITRQIKPEPRAKHAYAAVEQLRHDRQVAGGHRGVERGVAAVVDVEERRAAGEQHLHHIGVTAVDRLVLRMVARRYGATNACRQWRARAEGGRGGSVSWAANKKKDA